MKTDNRAQDVIQRLRRLIADQPPGTRLPTVRDLMRSFAVGPLTVQRAFRHLLREGLIDAQPGRGTFVAARPVGAEAQAPDTGWQAVTLGAGRVAADALAALTTVPPPHALALNAGYLPDELQATGLLGAAVARALRRPGVWNRCPPEGMHDLRAWFAAEAAGGYRPHEVVVCPGTQAALAASFRALAAPGDPVLMESPTYVGALAAARAAGLRPVAVPIDAGGVRPALLAEAFRSSGARLFYCQPTYANPTGAVLAPERRSAVLDILAEFGAFLLEDDWARDFSLDDRAAPPPLAAADRDGHVIYVRSLTKCAAPGLRIGAICARGPVLGRLRTARMLDDFFVSPLLQEAAVQLVSSPTWPRHLRRLRTALRARRDALARALRDHLGPACLEEVPRGGLHLWVALPDGVSDDAIADRAARDDILVSPGRHWFPAEPPGPFLRLSFAALHPENAADAAARLAALREPAAA